MAEPRRVFQQKPLIMLGSEAGIRQSKAPLRALPEFASVENLIQIEGLRRVKKRGVFGAGRGGGAEKGVEHEFYKICGVLRGWVTSATVSKDSGSGPILQTSAACARVASPGGAPLTG